MKNTFVGQGVAAALREKLKMKIMGGRAKGEKFNKKKGIKGIKSLWVIKSKNSIGFEFISMPGINFRKKRQKWN